MLTQPETVLLVAGIIWITAALATGLPDKRFPSEFPFLFSIVGFIAALIGVTELVPENVDILLTAIGVTLFAITPIIVTVKLYRAYPPIEEQRGGATAQR